MELDTDRLHAFAPAPERLWRLLSATDRYRSWWPWLREFDGAGLTGDSVWTCAVRAPLGYLVRFQVTLHDVEFPHFVAATISGDIEGTARIEVTPNGTGSTLRLTTRLSPTRPLLRSLTRIAPPVARWCHDRVLRSGIHRFRSHNP